MGQNLYFDYLQRILNFTSDFIENIMRIEHSLFEDDLPKNLRQSKRETIHALINHEIYATKVAFQHFDFCFALFQDTLFHNDKVSVDLGELLARLRGHCGNEFYTILKFLSSDSPNFPEYFEELTRTKYERAFVGVNEMVGQHLDCEVLFINDENRNGFCHRIGLSCDHVISKQVASFRRLPFSSTSVERYTYMDIEKCYEMRDQVVNECAQSRPDIDKIKELWQDMVELAEWIPRKFRRKAYYQQFYPSEVSDYRADCDCLCCHFKILHCVFEFQCGNPKLCIRHRILSKTHYRAVWNPRITVTMAMMFARRDNDEVFEQMARGVKDAFDFPHLIGILNLFKAKFHLELDEITMPPFSPDRFHPISLYRKADIRHVVATLEHLTRAREYHFIPMWPDKFLEFLAFVLSGHFSQATSFNAHLDLQSNFQKQEFGMPSTSQFVNTVINEVFLRFRRGHPIYVNDLVSMCTSIVEPQNKEIFEPMTPTQRHVRARPAPEPDSDFDLSDSDEELDDAFIRAFNAQVRFRRLRDAQVID